MISSYSVVSARVGGREGGRGGGGVSRGRERGTEGMTPLLKGRERCLRGNTHTPST
jgi:hypothetical protein